jgi:OOP family OmpA-OmpF porin
MTRPIRRCAPLLMLLAAACDRSSPPAAPPRPTPSASEKSIMRPAIQAEAEPVSPKPALPKTVTIPFAYDGATLDEPARALLDALAHDPATGAAQAIVIRGHTDASGSDRANLHVSLERATAVRDYLVAAGVKASMTLIPIGERRPLRPSATLDGADDPEGRAANRRVEITLR